MNKKILTRISSLLIVVAMAALLVASFITPAMGQTATVGSGVNQLSGINTNWQQYLDGSTVFKLPDTVKSTDEISIIIQLDNPALLDAYEASDKTMSLAEFAVSDEAEAIRNEIALEKSDYLARLDEAGISYSTGVNYDTVIAGFEIVITASDFESACSLLGTGAQAIVGEVYEVADTQLVNNKVDYYEDTGIFDSSDFAFDGSGMVVAVLDTGLDYTHTAFSPDNFTSTTLGLTKEMVAALIGRTEAAGLVGGLTADDVYINDKVPFSFDYADYDSDVYSMHNNHGTHVSGVIVGKDDTIIGVAPNAQLVSMKIFSDTVDSARSSWILAALEDCVILGVDVINMSLGTACGFSRETDKDAISGVYDRIRAAGISLVVAASNSYNSAYASEKNGNLPLTSNPDSGTVGSPSTYEGALSVASISGKKTPYMLYGDTIMYFTEATNSAQKEKDFFGEILPEGTDSVEIEYILIPGAGRAADYTGLDMTGKIALVRRGSTTFEEKATAAYKAGAAGIVIFNNVAGDIKMNAGSITIPICSISQDDGEMLAAAGSGTLTISRDQTSGPFISDFSSWGPTPSLEIKPEITAHGGNILSAITGGGYDRLSGTSMACPNMAGATLLLRQYVVKAFPDIADDPVKVAALVNQLFMSTADILLGQNGLPYSVRKQGAGLANLDSAAATDAYILTYDRNDGSTLDKTKIELGDDPDRNGVYTLNFSVVNFGYYDLSYNLSAYVLTEGVSETKTHAGETTVTEEAYSLDGAKIEIISVSGGTSSGMRVNVPAGETVDISVRITLGDEDKRYLDESFENGMYVEGYVTLDPVSGTDVALNAPYLAFYGDWTEAPLFDLDYFETNKDELDDSIETLDKTLPDAYASRPIGGVELDYVSYLGSYYFLQNPKNEIISASRDYIAISNQEGSVHSLRFVWAGLLRNAEKIVITITDTTTGEVVFETVDTDVRKSYGDGGSIYPANVEIEFDTTEYNLKNNTQYMVKLQGYLDYGNGGLETNDKNTFEFPFTVDFQAPAITDCEFYTEYDSDLEKMRLFAKLAIYDNHYAMAMQVGYISGTSTSADGYLFNNLDSYLTPIYSSRNSTNYVTYELTDYIYEIKENCTTDFPNSIVVSCYDYALNEATYQIPLPDDFTEFYFEDTEITLSVNQVFTLDAVSFPGTEWPELLKYTATGNNSIIRVVNNRIVAVGKGEARVIVSDPNTGKQVTLRVKVLGEGDAGFQYYDKPVADVFELIGYNTEYAYFYLSTSDRDIGATGDVQMFNGSYSLKLFPSESVSLNYKLDEYFPNDTKVVFESSNESIVSIDENGVITANAEGYASVSVSVYLDGKMTYYSESVDIEVKDPYITSGPSLTHYFGLGGYVSIPERLELTEIGAFAFSNYDYVEKDATDEISEDDPDATKQTYLGDSKVKEVVIPEGVTKIGAYAFAGITTLEKITLPSTLEAIEYGAFLGCTSLKTVVGLEHVKLINKWAFEGCNLTGELNIGGAHAISDYAFAYNRNITSVVLPATLRSIGAYAFAGDTSLASVTSAAASVKYGPYVFSGCSRLKEIEMKTAVIPAGAFYNCPSLEKVIIGSEVSVIGELAFYNTAIKTFDVTEGNSAFSSVNDGAQLVSADGTTLILVAPGVSGAFELIDERIKTVGTGAFSANSKITSVSIPSADRVENYAFYGCYNLNRITLAPVSYIGEYAFAETAITSLPAFASSLEEIGTYSFAYTDITYVSIPSGMTVCEGAFAECKSLANVVIGDNAVIGAAAFMLDRNTSLPDPDTEDIPYYMDEEYGKPIYYYDFKSELKSLRIGKNVTIGNAAFFGASKLESVTLGEGAIIGDSAFYNATSLVNIDLSGVVSIGDFAFSGDVHYVFTSKDYDTTFVYIKDGYYVYRYYAPKLTSVDLSSVKHIGANAFQYCIDLKSVTLGAQLDTVSEYAFGYCTSLESINLDKVVNIEEGAFSESGLKAVSLDNVKYIGEYAFVYCEELENVKIGVYCNEIAEGAFAYCYALSEVSNLKYVSELGAYSFAYTALTDIDLTMAVSVGDHAFIKEEFTSVSVTLGDALRELGDNPFAMCILAPFSKEVVTASFGGVDYTEIIYTYDISETVFVIDGSLYCAVPSGLELTVYAGSAPRAVVADGTVRISAYAFAGSGVEDVTLPASLGSIGHKAFYGCNSLDSVVFKSYNAPILEEEFDQSYYDDLVYIPATGEYQLQLLNSSFENYQIIYRQGLGIVPYYMWNITSSKYSNFYYGANFVDYIGHVDLDIEMVRPVNGVDYETFIYGQYFKDVQDGAAAADDVTQAAIDAIMKISGIRVTLQHEQLVIAAREAYDKIATELQRALVSETYNDDGESMTSILTSAERRIAALKSAQSSGSVPDEEGDGTVDTPDKDDGVAFVIVITAILLVGGIATVVLIYRKNKKEGQE